MDLKLGGKNVVLLGGTRGIGKAIAESFAAEGANIALCARNPDQVAEAVAQLGSLGVRAFGAATDVCDQQALTAWIGKAAAELGGIDILVSNAGAMDMGNDPAAWERNFRLDVMAGVNAFAAAEPYLSEAAGRTGDAAFVIISSVSAAQADRADAYGPLKAALVHMAKGLARQYARAGIRVNSVSPGMVLFEGGVWDVVRTNAPEFFKAANARNPTGRCAAPEEIAHAVVFLASPLSSYTTGANLVIDGALSSRVNF